MNVLAINGSARKDGNTAIFMRYVLDEIEKAGIETEMMQMAGKKIQGCIACYKCFKNKNQRCSVKEDTLNGYLGRMVEADGIILGSPVYFSDVTAEMKALIDRTGFVAKANEDMFKRKVGAAVVVARRAATIHTFDTINHFFLISQMVIPGSNYWNMGIGMDIGDVESDKEGIATMRILGQNMAWLIKKLKS